MFDPNVILDYMDASLDNAKACLSILRTLEANIETYRRTIDEMTVARAKFYEAHQEEIK